MKNKKWRGVEQFFYSTRYFVSDAACHMFYCIIAHLCAWWMTMMMLRYPLAAFLDHIKCCHMIFWSLALAICHSTMVTAVRNGLGPEKETFTLQMVESILRRSSAAAKILEMDKWALELLKEARASQ
jgi:hypothetical protein